MNERDRNQVRLLLGLGAVVFALHYPKTAAALAAVPVLVFVGTIAGVRAMQG